MWNLTFGPPQVIQARALTRLPDSFRKKRRTAWADANKPGHEIDCFLEGPSFDRAGNLYVTDIPYGRIFRISPQLEWTLVAEYDGWPNGSAFHRDGSLWITDYRRGLLKLRVSSSSGTSQGLSEPEVILGHRNSESFRGVNDLTFDREGNCYFTDQGQTGLHDPSGRVYRLRPNGVLDLVVGGVPSPNGVALDTTNKFIFIAVTRANAVWRGPLLADGSATKANVAYRPGTSKLVMTESESGSILEADPPAAGAALYSHS